LRQARLGSFNKYKEIKMKTKILFISAWAFILSSCGGGGGSSDPSFTQSGGLASDGYLSDATVFLDLNGNGAFNAGEPNTKTSSDGSYSLSYDSSLSGNIVVIGGTDIATGKAFTGKLEAVAASGQVYINPVSTMVAKKVKAQGGDIVNARAAVAASLGIDSSKLDKDPITLQKEGDGELAGVAMAVQKTIEDLANAAKASGSSESTADIIDNIFTNFAIEASESVTTFDDLVEKAVVSTSDKAVVLPIAVKKSKDNAKKRFNAVKELVKQIDTGSKTGGTATLALDNIQKLVEQDLNFAKEKYQDVDFVLDDTSTFAIEIKAKTDTAIANLIDTGFIENKVVAIAIEAKTGATDTAVIDAIKNLDSFDIEDLTNDEFLEDLDKIASGEINTGVDTKTFTEFAEKMRKEKEEALAEQKQAERDAKSGSFTLPEALTIWDGLDVEKDDTDKIVADFDKVRLNGSSVIETDFEYYKGLAGGWTKTADVAGSPTYTWTKDETWVDEENTQYQLVNNKYEFNNYETVSVDYADDISGKSLYYNGTYIAQMPQSYTSVKDMSGNIIDGSIEYGLNINKDNVIYVGNVFSEANPYTSLSSFINRRCVHLDKPLRKYDSDGNGSYDVAITMVSVGTKTANSKTICDYNSTESGTIALYEWDESSGKFTNTALVADFGTWERKTIHDKEVIVATPHQSVSGDCDDECGSKQPLWTMKKLNASTDTAVVWSGNLVNKEFKSYAYNPVAAKAIRGKTKARLNGIVAKSSEQGFVFTQEMLAGNTFYTVDPKGDMYIDAFNSDASKIITTESDGSTFSATVNTIDNSIDITDDNDGTQTKLIPISKGSDAGDYYRVAFEDPNGSISEGRMFVSQAVAQAYQSAKKYKVKPITGETAFKFDEGDLALNASGTTTFYMLTKTYKGGDDESIIWGWEHGKMEFNTPTFAYTYFNSGFIGDSISNNSGTFTISDGVINFTINSETIKFIPVGSSTRNNITYYRYIDDDQSSEDPSIHPGYMFLTREDMLNFKP
jgi:hypothetical protein